MFERVQEIELLFNSTFNDFAMKVESWMFLPITSDRRFGKEILESLH